MGFKDTVRADLTGVFFNENEFAGRNGGDPHTWDGAEIPAVLDSNIIQSENSLEYQGFPSGTLTVFIPVGEIDRPKEGSGHKFDGMLLKVWEIKEEMGMYVVVLVVGGP